MPPPTLNSEEPSNLRVRRNDVLIKYGYMVSVLMLEGGDVLLHIVWTKRDDCLSSAPLDPQLNGLL